MRVQNQKLKTISFSTQYVVENPAESKIFEKFFKKCQKTIDLSLILSKLSELEERIKNGTRVKKGFGLGLKESQIKFVYGYSCF